MSNLALAVDSSNLSTHEKSNLRKWFERAGGPTHLARAKGAALEGGHVVRAVGEGGVTGALLGALDGTLTGGLDATIPGTQTKVPLDALAAGAALVGAVVLGHMGEDVREDARNVAGQCTAIWSFRKTTAYVRSKGGISNMAGEITGPKSASGFGTEGPEDPIVACAKAL